MQWQTAMEMLQQLALAGGLAWASGIRLYAAIFIVGLLGRRGYAAARQRRKFRLPAHKCDVHARYAAPLIFAP
jgi:hypothetical protein